MELAIEDLPKGVSLGKIVLREERLWRVRLGKKFTGGSVQSRHFQNIEQAKTWIFGQKNKASPQVSVVALKEVSGTSAFQLTSSQIAEAINAFQRLSPVELGINEAVTYAITHLRPSGGNLTLSEAAARVLALKKPQVGPKHMKGLKTVFKKIQEDLGSERLSTLTREILEAWLSDQDDVSLCTKASYARHIHILFSEGVERGWCAKNPAAKLQRSISHVGDITVWTAQQMRSFLDAALIHEPQLTVPIAIKAFSGLRTSELLRLDWEQIGDRTIQVFGKNAKTRRSRGIEIQPVLRQWLKGKRSKGRVVGLTETGWHDAIHRVCEASKIKMPPNILRHSFGTYRYYHTKSEAETAYEMGNSPGVILNHYRAVAIKQADVSAWWRLYPVKTKKKCRA